MATKKKDEYQGQGTKHDSFLQIMGGQQPVPTKPKQGTKHDSFLAIMGGQQPLPTQSARPTQTTGQISTVPTYTPTQAPTFNANGNPWYQQAQQLMGQIQNRGPFEFNLNQNALYQQYKDNYMKQGQQAMMDTMGQAAGLTGGYGSSYAQNVGQQAYNEYLTKLGDIVPDLYAQERAAYDAQGQDLYNQLAAARGMYDTDYGIWRDQVGDARYQDELAYGRSRDAISDQRYQDELAYSRQRDALNDQWRQREYDDSRADLLYNRQYQEGRDRISDERYAREYADSRADILYGRQYQEGRDAINDARYADELAYGRSRDAINDARYADELAYGRSRDAINDARYADELAYGRSRDAINDQRYQDELAYNRQRDTVNDARYADELAYGRSRDAISDARYNQEYADSRSDSTYNRVMQQISNGYMPSAEELQAAGISQGYAQYLVNLYAQQQAAAAQGSTGGGGYSGGHSGGGYGGGSGGVGGDATDPSPNAPTDPGTTVDGKPVEAMPAGYDVNRIRNWCMGAENQASAKQRLNRYSRYLTAEQYNTIYQLILGGWGTGNYLV
jgi:hypothetical protein